MMEKNWRTEFVLAHQELFHPPRGYPESAPGYPDCGEGWRSLLDRTCVRIGSVLAYSDNFRVVQIKEKYGTLRFYWEADDVSPETEDAIEEAIALAMARSACTCEICGAEGQLYDRGG